MKLLLVALRSTIGFESTNLPFWAPVQIAPIDYCDQAIWGSLGTTTAVGAFINTSNYFLLIIHTVSFDRSHLTTCNWWLEAMTQSIYFQLHFWNINLEATEAWKYDSNVTRWWKKEKCLQSSKCQFDQFRPVDQMDYWTCPQRDLKTAGHETIKYYFIDYCDRAICR